MDARHVVDGHREKTLALLWQIIFHFQVRYDHAEFLNIPWYYGEYCVRQKKREKVPNIFPLHCQPSLPEKYIYCVEALVTMPFDDNEKSRLISQLFH